MEQKRKRSKGKIKQKPIQNQDIKQAKFLELREKTENSWKTFLRQTIDHLMNTELQEYVSECLPNSLMSKTKLRREHIKRIEKIEANADNLKGLKKSIELKFNKKMENDIKKLFPKLSEKDKQDMRDTLLDEKLDMFYEMLWQCLRKVEWDFEGERLLIFYFIS